MIQLNNREKKFINDNKNLIEDNNWSKFIDNLNIDYFTYDDIDFKNIMQFIYFDCDVNFLRYIDFIPDNLFCGRDIVNFTIPNNIHRLGYAVFYGCSNLESVDNFKNIENIQDYTFSGCEKLKFIDASSAESLGKDIFSNCSSLEEVILSKDWYIEDSNRRLGFMHSIGIYKDIIKYV